jgi:hypothetical protein
MINDEIRQREVCKKWGAQFLYTKPFEKLGVAANAKGSAYPLNGLRHRPVGDTCGWYIWAGAKLSEDEDFFLPLHAAHLDEWCPDVKKYLGLGPGWRFIIAPHYEDVWFDPSLIF